jgi:hypothetical protein
MHLPPARLAISVSLLIVCAGTHAKGQSFQKIFNNSVTSLYSVLEVQELADGSIVTAGGTGGRAFLLKTSADGTVAF